MKKNEIDGRWFLGGSHLTLLLISVVFFSLQRSPFQIVSVYVATLTTELFFSYVSKKNKHRKLGDLLFSAATEAAGLLILVRSSFEYAYIIFGIAAVASKYLLRLDEKRHMFNPTNIAIVTGFVLIPRHYFEVRPDDFSVSLYPILHVLVFGICATYFAKTWTITLSFVSSCCVISLLLSALTQDTEIYFLGPEIGTSGLIFMFLMITDPKTTPTSKIGQYIFGVSIAVFLYTLRYFEVFYAYHFALFLTSLLRGILEFAKMHYGWVPFRRNVTSIT